MQAQCFAQQWMADLVVAESFFELRILQQIAREKTWIDTYVDIFVDRR